MKPINRRRFLKGTAASTLALSYARSTYGAEDNLDSIRAEIRKRHDEAALHGIRGAGRKLPVNLVLVAEGEEEIGSPHFPQIVRQPEVQAALKPCFGVFMPSASQDLDGNVTIDLGAKGVVELELRSSGE